MLHKYKQNITFNVINIQIYTKKKNPWRNKKWVIFPWGGEFSIIVFWPPGHFSMLVNILSDTGSLLDTPGVWEPGSDTPQC